MKKGTTLKIIFNRIFNKIAKVDNIEKIEEGLNSQKQALKKLSSSYYDAVGALENYKNELKKNQENEKQLNKAFEKCKQKNNKDAAKEVYNEIVATKTRIANLKETSQKQEEIVERFKKAKERYEKEIRKLQTDLETMKAKTRFSKTVKAYEEDFGKFEEFDIKDIQRDIDVEFNASNAQLEEDGNSIDIDKIQADNDFEEMWGK